MINLPDDVKTAASRIERMVRRVGLREVSRRTGIPLTTVARRAKDILGTRFETVVQLIRACDPKKS